MIYRILFLLLFLSSLSGYNQTAPSAIYPNNNIVLNDSVVNFNWNTDYRYLKHEIQISTDSLFTNIVINDSSVFLSQFTSSLLNYNTSYFWRVRGKLNSSFLQWSDFNRFIIISPSSLDSLQFWMDATEISSLNNEDPLSTYVDLGPDAHVLSQDNLTKQPIYYQNTINSKPSVYFDGGDALEGGDILDRNGPFSFFAIVKLDAPLNNCSVFSKSKGVDGGLYLGANAATDKIVIYSDDMFVYDNLTRFEEYFCLISFNATNDSVFSYFNNSKYYTAENTSDLIGDNIFNFVVGAANFSLTYNWNGYISEIIINNSELSDSLINLYNTYLMDKYAPPINLGSDTSSCSSSILIDAYNNCYKTYLWEDNSTDSVFTASTSGYYYITTTDVFGRESSDSVFVNIDTSTFSVDIISDTTLCAGDEFFINAGPSHLNYSWSNGNSTPYLLTDTSGTFYVTVTDCNGNNSYDTIQITFNDYSFSFDIDSTLCYFDTLRLNPGFSQSLNYSWSNGESTSFIDVSNIGDYSVEISDAIGCAFFSDTAVIIMDYYPLTTSLGEDDTLCVGQSLFLKTGATETISYLWSTGDMENYTTIGAEGNYSVITTNTIGCIAKDTVYIYIKGLAPIPGFFNEYQCIGDVTMFTDTSISADESNIINWQWDFGDLETSNLQNPLHTYSDTGTYQINLLITTDSTCENTLIKNIKIYSNPEAHFTTNQLCQNYLVNFINTSTSAMGAIDYSRWDFGNNDTTNETSTQHFVTAVGDFPVELKVHTIDGCESIFDTVLKIKPSPIANFSQTAVCAGENTNFTDQTEISGVMSIIAWWWETDQGNISTLTNPSFNFPNSQYVQVSLKATSVNGCTDTISKNLWIYENPSALFDVEDACLNNPIIVNNLSTDNQSFIQSYHWWLNNILISQLETPYYLAPDTGIHSMRLKVLSGSGCTNTISKSFVTHALPNSNYQISETYTTPFQSIVFIADTIDDNYEYYYQFGDSASQSIAEASHAYADSGYYQTKLITTSPYACIDSTEKSVQIVQPLLDLAISNLGTFEEGGKTRISVLLSNIGNLDVNNITFRIEMSEQSVFEENFTDLLRFGESQVYILNSQFLFDNEDAHFLCLSAEVNSIYNDIDLSNNSECIGHDVDENLLKLYPNPATDQITILYRADETETLPYEIIDDLGRVVLSGGVPAQKDIHKYNISISPLANGMYVLRIKDSLRKFTKE